jgi:L-lactate dehydrogenase complex protein LldE
MKTALFIPCYIDQFYPQVAVATLELLEKLGCEVAYPTDQTCCGQPLANAGFAAWTKGCEANFLRNFEGYEAIVCPSGSCTLHVKEHLQGGALPPVYELCEFLTDVLKVEWLDARFPHRVGLHNSCHGQRGLHLSSMSERMLPPFSKPTYLLQLVENLQLVPLERPDECCGFGGTFSVFEEAVSVKMGKDRLADHLSKNVEVITGGDMSCLMHLEGILRRQGRPLRVMHVAEILNAT